jgi:hypothetical protein
MNSRLSTHRLAEGLTETRLTWSPIMRTDDSSVWWAHRIVEEGATDGIEDYTPDDPLQALGGD